MEKEKVLTKATLIKEKESRTKEAKELRTKVRAKEKVNMTVMHRGT